MNLKEPSKDDLIELAGEIATHWQSLAELRAEIISDLRTRLADAHLNSEVRPEHLEKLYELGFPAPDEKRDGHSQQRPGRE